MGKAKQKNDNPEFTVYTIKAKSHTFSHTVTITEVFSQSLHIVCVLCVVARPCIGQKSEPSPVVLFLFLSLD